MNERLKDLLDDLSTAIDNALCGEDVMDALARIEEAVGKVEIAVDVFLPAVSNVHVKRRSTAINTEDDLRFLRSMRIEP